MNTGGFSSVIGTLKRHSSSNNKGKSSSQQPHNHSRNKMVQVQVRLPKKATYTNCNGNVVTPTHHLHFPPAATASAVASTVCVKTARRSKTCMDILRRKVEAKSSSGIFNGRDVHASHVNEENTSGGSRRMASKSNSNGFEKGSSGETMRRHVVGNNDQSQLSNSLSIALTNDGGSGSEAISPPVAQTSKNFGNSALVSHLPHRRHSTVVPNGLHGRRSLSALNDSLDNMIRGANIAVVFGESSDEILVANDISASSVMTVSPIVFSDVNSTAIGHKNGFCEESGFGGTLRKAAASACRGMSSLALTTSPQPQLRKKCRPRSYAEPRSRTQRPLSFAGASVGSSAAESSCNFKWSGGEGRVAELEAKLTSLRKQQEQQKRKSVDFAISCVEPDPIYFSVDHQLNKAAGQEKLGIYIKSVVKNGSADLDGRLATGDQLLSVDGQSLVGISQEEAAKYLVRTGPIVSLEVAKQAAVYQGIASMLNQPSPETSRDGFNASRRMSEKDLPSRVEFVEPVNGGQLPPGHPLLQPRIHSSKSVPSLNTDQHQPTTVVPPMVRSPGHPGSVPYNNHDATNSHVPRYSHHYPSSSMTMHHSGKNSVPIVNDSQHSRSRSIQSLSDPPYRPDIGSKQPSTPALHQQSEEPERFYQNVGFYPPPPPPPTNPVNVPVRTYIPYSNSTGNISSQGFRSPTSVHPPVQYPHYPNPRQLPPNLNSSVPGNLNWPRAGNPGVSRDLLRQEAKMLEMQDELRRREERAAIMMSKAQQSYPLRYGQSGAAGVRPGYRPAGNSASVMPKNFRDPNDSHHDNTQFSASKGDIPKGAFSYNNGMIPKSPSIPANPWDREAKEEEAVRKKEAARYWRDQQISELECMPYRSPSQEEQLRALKLEREFQRRAEEIKKDDDGENEEEDDDHNERKSMIRKLQEDLEKTKISTNGGKLDHVEEERSRKIEEMKKKKMELEAAQAAEERLVREAARRREEELKRQMQQHSFPYQSPYRSSFGSKPMHPNQSSFSEGPSTLSPSNTIAPPLPNSPPPSLSRNPGVSSPEKNSVPPPQVSPRPKSDKKTVSFNETVATNEPPPSPTPTREESTEKVREDPNKFFTEATAMLSSPRSPDVVSPGTGNTPGVIGAQEVYRDPRMRRLAEQQQKQQQITPKPEKLTFKEKMKMFAMESGDADTPRDKVKVSSKQREIETPATPTASK